jgi:lambda family phage portal protein
MSAITLYDPYNRPLPPAARQPRVVIGKRQNYEGAEPSHLMADWLTSSLTADEAIRPSAVRLRNRCRSLERDNSYVRRFLTLLKIYVFGWRGIALECKCRHQRRRDRLHKELNDKIKSEWDQFGELGQYDVTGKFSCRTGDIFALRRCVIDGEIFIRLVRGYPNRWNFAVQFIEADWIDIDHTQRLENGNTVRSGIEFDEWDRPVAYYIRESTTHPYQGMVPRIRISTEDMIHLGIFERANQSRCVPWISSAITNLRQFGEYERAEIITARVCSSKMGMIERDIDSAPYTGGVPDDQGNLVSEVAPGVIEVLDPGQKFVPFDPGQPKTEFAAFRKAALRGIACAFDVGYNALASDLEGVNYSSLRHGQKDDVEVYRDIQSWYIWLVRQRIFSSWLEMATLSGRIDVEGYGFENIESVLEAVSWKARGYQYIDPHKDATADLLQISNKLETRTNVLARRGLDIHEVFETLEYEEELADEHGLDLSPVGVGGGGGAPRAPGAGAGGTGGGTGEPPAQPRAADQTPLIVGNGWLNPRPHFRKVYLDRPAIE